MFINALEKEMNSLRIKFTDDTKLLDFVNMTQDRDVIKKEAREDRNEKSQWPDLPIEICEGGFYVPTDNNQCPLTNQTESGICQVYQRLEKRSNNKTS